MFKRLKKWFYDWATNEPYVDNVKLSIDGTPLVQLITPRGSFSGWSIKPTDEGCLGSVIQFGIERDFGANIEYAIDALEGRLNNLFTDITLAKIALITEAVVKRKGYTAFKHNGKPYMEFVKFSLDPKDVKRLKQALIEYNFLKDTTKQKS